MNLNVSGERIKEMRKKRGLTQTELASKLLGIDTDRGKSKISEYEHGKNLTLKNIQELAKALECDPDYLLGCMDHPDITTSWIAEQIPLSREAIEALKYMGYELKEYGNSDAGLFMDIIDAIVIELLKSLNESLNKFVYPDGTYTIEVVEKSNGSEIHRKPVPLESSTVFEDIVNQVYAYETISEYESGNKTELTYREYDYAKLAIMGTKARIGNYLSDIVAGAMKSRAELYTQQANKETEIKIEQ